MLLVLLVQPAHKEPQGPQGATGPQGPAGADGADGGGLANVVEDTTPQLGGSLDVNGQDIVSVSNGNITLTPNGAGVVRLDGNVDISTGAIDLKNGGSQSYVRFYCESSNAHYAQLQAPAHSAFSGNITLTLPATAGTVALTSDIADEATALASPLVKEKKYGKHIPSSKSRCHAGISAGSTPTVVRLIHNTE